MTAPWIPKTLSPLDYFAALVAQDEQFPLLEASASIAQILFFLFLVIFLWTPPHFWALAIRHSDEYRAAGVPMLPAVETPAKVATAMTVYCAATVVASLALVWVADLGLVYSVTAGVLGAVFLGGTIALGRAPSAAGSMRLFSFSITYLSVLFVALTVDVLVR